MSTWEPFTERARRSIVLAQEEAQRLGSVDIGPEHLLLGILADADNPGARELVSLGADVTRLRREVQLIAGAGGTSPAEGTFGPDLRRIIAWTFEAARERNHNAIGTEHLLLGLVSHGDNAAVRALVATGIDVTEARRAAVTAIESPAEPKGSRWDGFTETARRALVVAQGEAQRRGQAETGCEHLLFGLVSENRGHAVRALALIGTDLQEFKRRLTAGLTSGSQTRIHEALRFDLPASRALEFAARRPIKRVARGSGPNTSCRRSLPKVTASLGRSSPRRESTRFDSARPLQHCRRMKANLQTLPDPELDLCVVAGHFSGIPRRVEG